jgi:phosphate-selective porin OprO and OprP
MKTSLALALIATTATTASAQPSPASPATPETAQGPAAAAAPDRQASPVDTTLPAAPVDRAALAASIDAQIDARVSARVDEILAARPEKAGWNDGFYLQSGDGKHKLRFGAIIQFEGRIFFADEDDPRTDQWTFRSLRPELAGTLFGRFDFRLMPDFAGGRLSVQDAYVDLRATDAVRLRFGKFKVPFGLERLQSETTTLFAERGLPSQLAPNRDLGIQVFGDLAGGAFSYQVGAFNGVADGGSGDGDVSDDKELAARIFVKPFAKLSPLLAELGVGAAVTYGDKQGTLAVTDLPSFRTSAQASFFAYKTGNALMEATIAAGAHYRASAQANYFAGPVGALAEYVYSSQKIVLGGNHERINSDAWQVAAQWVLTGEKATWKGVSPAKPLDPGKGQWGAFDLVARVGQLRFLDGDLFEQGFADPTRAARRATSAGVGLDWFPNRSIRFVLDFESTWFRLGAKDPDTTGTSPAFAADRSTENTIVARIQTVF